jgi:Spy/CpxP family protein refolding chaperone
MGKRAEATKAFYAALTAEQKKVFDAESLHRRGGHPGGRHHKG